MTDEKTNLYYHDLTMLYQYGDRQKVVNCNAVRKAGFEVDLKQSERGTIHESKLDESIIRAKSTIFELAYCNTWDFFITLTIDPSKYDRTDLKRYYKVFTQWLRDYRKKYGISISYLFVPELHEKGNAWHMHGLIAGLSIDHLRLFEESEKLPHSILNEIRKGRQIFDWTAYREKFGYVSLSPIRSHQGISGYLTKYITKDAMSSIKDLNSKTYYCSHGLQRKELIKKGTLCQSIPDELWSTYGYVGDYAKAMTVPEGWDFEPLISPIN